GGRGDGDSQEGGDEFLMHVDHSIFQWTHSRKPQPLGQQRGRGCDGLAGGSQWKPQKATPRVSEQ
ncbi:MAG: hypothetical protein OXF59_16630, partial [Pseudomonas sp.]|nr:hypothetical protein [Pseudomonas sp.]